METTVRITNTATPALRSAIAQLRRPRPILAAASKAVVQLLKSHFRDRQAEGNKQRWPSSRFWFGVRGSVANSVGVSSLTDTSATVTIADPRFAHKITGGTITPKRAKFLTIPLRAEAKRLGGKGTLRESAPDLFVLKTSRGLWLVKSAWRRRGRGRSAIKSQAFQFWFKLVKSVTQNPDPRAMPKDEALASAVELAVIRILPTLLRRQGLDAK